MVKRRRLLTPQKNKGKVLKEKDDSKEVTAARGRLKGALRDALDSTSEESDAADDLESSDKQDSDRESSTFHSDSDERDKHYRKKSPARQSYVLKLFDRSVDLSQFSEDSPLYPICRAWIANQPKAIYRKYWKQKETKSNDEGLVLPKPVGPPISRIPDLLPIQRESNKDNINLDYRVNPPPSNEVLLEGHMARWEAVRRAWLERGALVEKRYAATQKVLNDTIAVKNGDLSKPSGGPRGRHFIQMKWKELCDKLNSDGTGDSRSEEKWRKVWSDLKNNTKRKLAKINRAASGTGGGPALQLSLTDPENRVIQIIGVEAATGMKVVEAGFQQNEESKQTLHTQPEEINRLTQPDEEGRIYMILGDSSATDIGDWNTPGTSSQPTVVPPNTEQTTAPPGPSSQTDEHWAPPPQKKKKPPLDDLSKLFVECDKSAREYARERDLAFERLQAERLRVHEYEVRERVRQRDQELQLQAQWLEFLKESMNVLKRYLEREDR